MMKILAYLRMVFCLLLFSVIASQYVLAHVPAGAHRANYSDSEWKVQQLLNKFTARKIQMSNFVMISPGGRRSTGIFYLQRPGKIRFYYKTLPLNVIADGHSVVVNNSDADSWSLYSLSNTPLHYLLANHMDVHSPYLQRVDYGNKQVVLEFAESPNSVSRLLMFFDRKSAELKKWIAVDANNKATITEIKDVDTNVEFEKDMFEIPYDRIAKMRN